MGSLMFLCPKLRVYAHGWTEEESEDANTYECIICSACGSAHMVNPATGRVLGSDEDKSQE